MIQRLTLVAFAISLAFQCETCVSAGTIFDVANDFSVAGNPNGARSYGYSTTLNGPLILNAETGSYGSGVNYWRTNLSLDVPSAFCNTSQQVATVSTVQLQPGQFGFHPGPNDEYEKARLTVPTTSTYSITGAFSGVDVHGTTTDVHILLNGVSIFDGAVNGFGPNTGPSFSLTKTLAANDTLDFAVGYGSNDYFTDSTGLAAHIAPVQGDYNGDGKIDAADYVVWRKGLGTIYTQADYDVWRAHFGQTAGSGAGALANAAVPEPTTLLLLMLAVVGSCLKRGRAA